MQIILTTTSSSSSSSSINKYSLHQLIRTSRTMALVVRLVCLIVLAMFHLGPADTKLLEPSCGKSIYSFVPLNNLIDSIQPIVYGPQLAKLNEFPFHVGVYWQGYYICGGVLIDSFRILTASECTIHAASGKEFKPQEMSVRVGDLDRSRLDGEQRLPVRRIQRHQRASLAMLILDGPIQDYVKLLLPGSVNSICLPRAPHPTGPSEELFITGWDADCHDSRRSDRLKKASVSLKICKQPRDGILCSAQEESGLCGGDTGGPLFRYVRKGQMRFAKLVGIITKPTCSSSSTSQPCDAEYVDISKYLDWMEEMRTTQDRDS